MSTNEIRDEWAQNVESGAYGWIDFSNGEVKNLDPYPQSRIDYLRANLYPDYSSRCFEQLRTFSDEITIEIHFQLSAEGHPRRFLIMSDRAVACGRDTVDALRSFSFVPGRRNGQAVTSVGEFTHRLSPTGGYRNGN